MASPSSPPRRSHLKGYIAAGLILAAVCGVLYLSIHNITDASGHPLNTLAPVGKLSKWIDTLALKLFIGAGIVFVLVEGAILFLIFRFRRHPDDEALGDEPVQLHGNKPLEWTWTALPALLLAVLAIFNVDTLWKLQDQAETAKMSVTVIGQQWWWEFRYDTDGDGETDIITANQLVIPVGETVALHIRSNDVIHSFWIPRLNGKKDAVPGRDHLWALQSDETGIFEGQCTEYCGLSHGYMRMQVKVLSAEDYATWVTNQQERPEEPAEGTEAAEGKALVGQKCLGCHQINGYDASGNELDSAVPDSDYQGSAHPLISGNAPNLTHLMSRERFAGGMFELYSSYRAGHEATTVDPDGEVNLGELGDWLRNPPNKKPMDADGNRGMPNLKLTDDEIEKIVAYLSTLK